MWEEALRLRDLLKFEFFFPRKRTFAEDVRAEMAILDPEWEQRPAEPKEIHARAGASSGATWRHRVLGPFVEAYAVVAEPTGGTRPADRGRRERRS